MLRSLWMKVAGSSGRNRPERSRLAEITRATSGPMLPAAAEGRDGDRQRLDRGLVDVDLDLGAGGQGGEGADHQSGGSRREGAVKSHRGKISWLVGKHAGDDSTNVAVRATSA